MYPNVQYVERSRWSSITTTRTRSFRRPESLPEINAAKIKYKRQELLLADEAQPRQRGPRGARRALFTALFSGAIVARPKSLLDLPGIHHTIVPVDLSGHPCTAMHIPHCVKLALSLLSG
ncbi:hypothetical protein B0J13DRAFT_519341 [Dactylonectria estremocensis]|uniref:Uncharacterized protein n=1 Tax=Dactylonectria estremocensis TaxID=1079267 RepID=A0A9P9FDL8_9HYPO|nr:hypothetical protein B0J13DRAFT_519341 [Dactylonectria estremocensis]